MRYSTILCVLISLIPLLRPLRCDSVANAADPCIASGIENGSIDVCRQPAPRRSNALLQSRFGLQLEEEEHVRVSNGANVKDTHGMLSEEIALQGFNSGAKQFNQQLRINVDRDQHVQSEHVDGHHSVDLDDNHLRYSERTDGFQMRYSGSLDSSQRRVFVDQARDLGRRYAAHNFALKRALIQAASSQGPSNNELDRLMDNFINNQAASQDRCPAQLLEAKHQMSVLHTTMVDISWEVNTSEVQIRTTAEEVHNVEIFIEELETECKDEEERCDGDQKNYFEMWETLKWELHEMYMIANPSVTMSSASVYTAASSSLSTTSSSSTSGSVGTSGWGSTSSSTSGGSGWSQYGMGGGWNSYRSALSLLQSADESVSHTVTKQSRAPNNITVPDKAGVQGVQELVQKTKRLAKEVEQCMLAFGDPGKRKHGDGRTLSFVQFSSFDRTKGSTTTSGQVTAQTSYSTTTSGSAEAGVCHHDDQLEVILGSVTKSVSAGLELRTGEHATVDCASINPEYTGQGWLLCNGVNLVSDFSGCASASDACKEQLHWLEVTYVKAYVELTRLVSQYEMLVNSTACIDTVHEQCAEKGRPWYVKLEKLVSKLFEMTENMHIVQGRVTLASRAEQKLRQHIAAISLQCQEMKETVSSLDKVRDVIHVIDMCPGLRRPQFHIPLYVGEYIYANFNLEYGHDRDIDQAMNALCQSKGLFNGLPVRAAETSEIELQTIEKIPLTNTATVPLMGACPNCEGDADDPDGVKHQTGHFRICWDPKAELNAHGMRTDCSSGKKAVLCVVDRGNLRYRIPESSS